MRFSRKDTLPVRTPTRTRQQGRGSVSVLSLVREGVERFILKDANIMAFMKEVRTAGKERNNSTHPLTGAAFRRIVREAIRKRKRRIGQPTGRPLKPGE